MKDITLAVLGCLTWLFGVLGIFTLGINNLKHYYAYGVFPDNAFYLIVPAASIALAVNLFYRLAEKKL